MSKTRGRASCAPLKACPVTLRARGGPFLPFCLAFLRTLREWLAREERGETDDNEPARITRIIRRAASLACL